MMDPMPHSVATRILGGIEMSTRLRPVLLCTLLALATSAPPRATGASLRLA